MPRYILIDNESGYVFADTADLPGFDGSAGTPLEAARLCDERIGERGRRYVELAPQWRPPFGQAAYVVYRADVGGSEAVPVVTDGQDADACAAVERLCDRVAVVLVHRPAQ